MEAKDTSIRGSNILVYLCSGTSRAICQALQLLVGGSAMGELLVS